MGIATWMMGKMMDKFLALPAQEKAQVIGTMAEKFWAAATPEETARVAEILVPRFVDAFLKGADDRKKQEVLRSFASPELIQRMVGEAAPVAVSAAMSSALPDALASRLPAAVEGLLPRLMEAWMKGLGEQQKKDLFGSFFPGAGASPASSPSSSRPSRPSPGGMMGGMMGGGPWG